MAKGYRVGSAVAQDGYDGGSCTGIAQVPQ
jgi:hypothetical protein